MSNLNKFQELADQWERETYFLSNSATSVRHLAHQEIISMGEEVIPLILKRMQCQGGHWFDALHQLTNASPVHPDNRGKIRIMQESWLQWGIDNGYIS